MDQTVTKAYTIIFAHPPEASLKQWDIIEQVLENWDVPKMGEDLAKESLFLIINHIPKEANEERMHDLIGQAESKIPELFPEIGLRDPDMHVVEWLEHVYWRDKTEGKNKLR